MSPRSKAEFRSIFISFVTFSTIIFVAIIIIAYGRGYRPDFRKNTLKPTGLLSVTSDPIAAQVYLNGTLKTATNNSLNVDPGWHKVQIVKEGFQAWEKTIRLQGEVVTRADAFLFPTSPSLSTLTSLGIQNPILSPDGTKVAFVVPSRLENNTLASKAGLWLYELSEKPLGRNRDPVQVATDALFDFAKAELAWSPDSVLILAVTASTARLYPAEKLSQPSDATLNLKQLLQEWDNVKTTKDKEKLTAFEQIFIDIATSSAKIISFSPDETKILYEATASATIPPIIVPALNGTNSTAEARTLEPGKIYVYDSREDKNFFVLDKKEVSNAKKIPAKDIKTDKNIPSLSLLVSQSFASSLPIFWFPTNRHLVVTLAGKIDIMEYDRTNWLTVYSGPFVNSFVAPWPNGSRIVILTSLNASATSLPNLYTVNLR